MTYILMVWTVVAMGGSSGWKAHDWRPIGEFHSQTNSAGQQYGKNAEQMCEAAARQLGWTSDQHQKYRCVRSK